MPRATVYQATQLGLEVTEGTAPAGGANKLLLCTGFNPTPNKLQSMYRPAGFRVPTAQVLGKEWSDGSIDGRLCFNDLSFLLNSLLVRVVPTTPTGFTLARQWAWKPLASAPDTIDTFTVEMGPTTALSAEQMTGCRVNALTMTWEQETADISGSFYGRRMVEGITKTASPTAIAASTVDTANVSVFVGTSQATSHVYTITLTGTGLGGTFKVVHEGNTSVAIAFGAAASVVEDAIEALASVGKGNVTVAGTTPTWTVTLGGQLAGLQGATMTLDTALLTGSTPGGNVVNTTPGSLTRLLSCDRVELAIPDVSAPVPTLNAAEPSYAFAVDIGYEPTGEIRLQHDSQSVTLMDGFRAGTTFLLAITARGRVIDAGIAYENLRITAPVRVTDSDRADQDGVWASSYPLALVNDAAFAGFLEIKVVNAITTLA